VLGDQRLYWVVILLVAARRVIAELPVWLPDSADAYPFVQSGRDVLSHPGSIYERSAALVATGYTWTVTWPPPQIVLAIPFGLAPPGADVWLWVTADAFCAVIGLILLFRSIRAQNRLALPIFVLVTLCFSPLFEDVRLGQRGGVLLLLACASMLVVRSRPVLGGVLAGIATSLKFYPAAMVLSVDRSRRSRFVGALAATATGVLAITFIPFGSPVLYVTKILLPVGQGRNPATVASCFENSTPQLFYRLVGGVPWSTLSTSTWSTVGPLPWHLPVLAQLLSYATIGLLIVGTVWASRRSSWAQPFSLALAFSLGALVPGDVYTYQFIALLPLTLVLVLTAVQQNRWVLTGVLGLAIWVLVSSPCALVFPGLWNIAGLAIFAVAMFIAAGTGQAPSISRSATPPSRIPATSGRR
jgi:glycosyl transferase family 87